MNNIHVQKIREMVGESAEISQIGSVGANSTAYLIETGDKRFVIKFPNNPNDAAWLRRQQQAIRCCDLVEDNDVVRVPNSRVMDGMVVEEYLGQDCSYDMFASMSDADKQKLAAGLADIINKIHQVNISPSATPGEKIRERLQYCKRVAKNKNLSLGEKFSILFGLKKNPPFYKSVAANLSAILEKYGDCFNDDIFDTIKNSMDYLKRAGAKDEIERTTHGDVRTQNLLFDKNTEQFALIDFELSKKGCIYRDFVPAAVASSGMSPEFLCQLASEYNKMSKDKVDIQKVKHLTILGYVDEMGRCAMYRGDSPEKFKELVDKRLKPQIQNIVGAFDKELDTGRERKKDWKKNNKKEAFCLFFFNCLLKYENCYVII